MTSSEMTENHDSETADIRLPDRIRWTPRIGDESRQLIARKLPGPGGDRVLGAAGTILARGVSPTETNVRISGLVAGYVQSGKTLSFTAVAAVARDNGFQLAIVIAGTSTPLFNQSTRRLHDDLLVDDNEGSLRWRVHTNPTEEESTRRSIMQCLEEWRDETVPRSECPTVLITVMKNYRHLENLVSLLRRFDLTEVPTLIVDDEADQASLNNLVTRDAQSTTYRRICELRDAVGSHTFLQYTATPQAPLLINIIDELSPEFVEVIEPGEGYVGGRDIFGPEANNLTRVIPPGDIISDDNPLEGPPESLVDALKTYLVGVSAGLIEGRGPGNTRRSMLVHPSYATDQHQEFREWITSTMDLWKEILGLPDSEPDRVDLINDFRDAYDDLAGTVENLPTFDGIIAALPRTLRNTSIAEINSRSGETPTVNWNQSYGWILVGGQAMDRGFTVEGLTVTYMPRGAGVRHADVIQQRARFFGYKSAYLGYCRIYLDQEVLTVFGQYVDHEDHIRHSLVRFSEEGRPLSEWKRAFILAPDLRPCRSSAIQYGYTRVSNVGQWVTVGAVDSPEELAENNRHAIQALVDSLEFTPDTSYRSQHSAQQHSVCESVPLGTLIESLIVPFRAASPRDSDYLTALSMQINHALEETPGETAIVYQMRPGQTAERTLTSEGRVAQVFQGPTRLGRDDADRYSYPGDRAFGDKERVSVQIHHLDFLDEQGQVEARNVPVLAFRMPARMSQTWLLQNQPT